MTKLSTLRKLYKASHEESFLVESDQDLRDMMALGYKHGGQILTFARMVERWVGRRAGGR